MGTLTWNELGTLQEVAITDPFNSSNQQNCAYNHDDLTRIAGVNCGTAWSQSFSYDSFGNVSKGGTISFQAIYSYLTNRMTQVGLSNPTYDANGNLLNDTTHTYTWDTNGKPLTIDGVADTYDALGRVVEQNHAGSYNEIVYSPTGAKLAIFNGQALQKAFVHLPGGAVAAYNSGGLLYYVHADRLGSAVFGSTQNRGMAFDMAYAPFGESYSQVGSPDPAFTGQRQDTVPSFCDFPAREYASIQGRWPSPDPAGLSAVSLSDPQTLNRYSYVRNSPLSAIDPSGKCNWFLALFTECGGPDGDNDSDDELAGNPLGGLQLPTGFEGCTTGPLNSSFFPNLSTAEVCVQLIGPQLISSSFDGQDIILDLGANAGLFGAALSPSAFGAQVGRAFQTSFNQTFNVEESGFKIQTELGNSRPDLISDSGDIMVGEIKSGQYVYMTNQLEVQNAYALANDLPHYVVISPESEVATTVVSATESTGGAVLTFNPATGALAQLTVVDGEVVFAEAAVSEATVEEFVALLLLL